MGELSTTKGGMCATTGSCLDDDPLRARVMYNQAAGAVVAGLERIGGT